MTVLLKINPIHKILYVNYQFPNTIKLPMYIFTSKTQTRTDLRPELNTQKAVITYIYILNLG